MGEVVKNVSEVAGKSDNVQAYYSRNDYSHTHSASPFFRTNSNTHQPSELQERSASQV